MEIKVIKIAGEFVVVELKDGRRKICPIEIFPENLSVDDVVVVSKILPVPRDDRKNSI